MDRTSVRIRKTLAKLATTTRVVNPTTATIRHRPRHTTVALRALRTFQGLTIIALTWARTQVAIGINNAKLAGAMEANAATQKTLAILAASTFIVSPTTATIRHRPRHTTVALRAMSTGQGFTLIALTWARTQVAIGVDNAKVAGAMEANAKTSVGVVRGVAAAHADAGS
jgi:hypothetical protein